MNLRRDRVTIMLVLTMITIVTLLLNVIVQADRWIVIILSITMIAEIVWFVNYFNGRGRK